MENNNKRMPEATSPLYFVVDEKLKSVDLTDKGNEWLAKQVSNPSLFILPDITTELSLLESDKSLTEEERLEKKDAFLQEYAVKSERVHTILQLLKAYTMFNRDDEYVVIDGEVKIVDEQTGRIMEGRRWSDGLHQAVEAKEHVKVEAATQTFATITLQNYFRMYYKLAGMTGTAITEAEEFWNILSSTCGVPQPSRDGKDLNDRVTRRSARIQPVIDEIRKHGSRPAVPFWWYYRVEISNVSACSDAQDTPQRAQCKATQKEADMWPRPDRAVPAIATNMPACTDTSSRPK